MIEYTICAGFAALPGNTPEDICDRCIAVNGISFGRAVIYRTDTGNFCEKPIENGRVFPDREFIEDGGEYAPRFFDAVGKEYRACKFTVRKAPGSGRLIALRRQESVSAEISDLWSALIAVSGGVKESLRISSDAKERVERLIDGYRTE